VTNTGSEHANHALYAWFIFVAAIVIAFIVGMTIVASEPSDKEVCRDVVKESKADVPTDELFRVCMREVDNAR
jgi:hypothetical protein